MTKSGDEAGNQWREAVKRTATRLTKARNATLRKIAGDVRKKVKADISAAGNFADTSGKMRGRFLTDFRAVSIAKEGKVHIYHKFGLAKVFEFGRTIHAKGKYMWLPAKPGTMLRSFKMRTNRRLQPTGGLSFVPGKGGAPLLVDTYTGEIMFYGISSVTIPKKFHIGEIVQEVQAHVQEEFKAEFASADGSSGGED